MNLRQSKILITRPVHQAQSLKKILENHGLHTTCLPLVKINCLQPNNKETINLKQYDWVFFTSANGVTCFFEQFPSNFPSKIAVVGKKTKEAVENHGREADFMPSYFNAKTLATEFLSQVKKVNRVLLVRGTLARPELAHSFKKAKIEADIVEVYETIQNKTIQSQLVETMHQIDFDYITFTSPSTVNSFLKLYSHIENIKAKVVCIGPTTSEYAEMSGFKKVYTAGTYTIEGMVETILDLEEGGK